MKEKSLISRDNMIKVTACSYKNPKFLLCSKKKRTKKETKLKGS
jgi:hypothetical protein